MAKTEIDGTIFHLSAKPSQRRKGRLCQTLSEMFYLTHCIGVEWNGVYVTN